jgi:hypothetical protein
MSGLAFVNDGPFTLTAGEALAAVRFIKLSASTAVYADAGDEPIGVTTQAVASGAMSACRPLNGGIQTVTASKAISAGAALYVAADGCVSDAAVGKQIGIALGAATGAGGRIAACIWGPRGGNDLLSGKGNVCEFFDDFFTFDEADDWIDSVSDGGTIDQIDAVNGVLSIATGGVDENESYVSSLAEDWLFQTDKRLFFEARVKLTEANTDDANIIVGLSDTVAADSLLDAGAGPMASYDGAVFFKVDGGTVWQAETSNAGTQATDTSAGTFNDGDWTKLTILYDYNDGVTANVYFYVDGVLGATLELTIAGLAEMHILLGAKAGGGNAETLLVDYVHVAAER